MCLILTLEVQINYCTYNTIVYLFVSIQEGSSYPSPSYSANLYILIKMHREYSDVHLGIMLYVY